MIREATMIPQAARRPWSAGTLGPGALSNRAVKLPTPQIQLNNNVCCHSALMCSAWHGLQRCTKGRHMPLGLACSGINRCNLSEPLPTSRYQPPRVHGYRC